MPEHLSSDRDALEARPPDADFGAVGISQNLVAANETSLFDVETRNVHDLVHPRYDLFSRNANDRVHGALLVDRKRDILIANGKTQVKAKSPFIDRALISVTPA
jgi:hypothetical protein